MIQSELVIMLYYCLNFISLYFYLEAWSNVEVYFLGLNLIQICYLVRFLLKSQQYLLKRIDDKKQKFSSLIKLIQDSVDQPLTIISQGFQGQIKTLFITKSLTELSQTSQRSPEIKELLSKLNDYYQNQQYTGQKIAISVERREEKINSLQSETGRKINSPSYDSFNPQKDYFQNLIRTQDVRKQEVNFEVKSLSPLASRIGVLEGKNFLLQNLKNVEEEPGCDCQILTGKREDVWCGKRVLILWILEKKQVDTQLVEKVKQLEQLHQYKDNLLAAVSHDFKTPLNGMILISTFLESISVDEEVLKYLDIIKKNAEMLKFMIHDIIDFSKMSKSQLSINPVMFSLDQVINEVLELMRLQAREKGVDLIYSNNFIQDEIFNDPNRLKQILLNLLSNSLKFTPQGRITIQVHDSTIRSRNSSHSASSLPRRNIIKITVSDTGVGIPDEIKPKLFNMWATFDHNNGSNKNGAGLGLVICRKLVGALGPRDKIEMESYMGVGTSMTFALFVQLPSDRGKSYRTLTVREGRQVSIQRDDQSVSRKSKINHGPQSISQFQAHNVYSHSQIQSRVFIPQDLQSRKTQQGQKKVQKHSNPSSPLIFEQMGETDSMEINEDDNGDKIQNINSTINVQNQSNKQIKLMQVKNRRQSKNTHLITQKESSAFFQPTLTSVDFQKDMLYQLISLDQEESEVSLLIVDDEVFNVMALKLALRRFSRLKIDEAYDGRQAIQLIEFKKVQGSFYSCILMDLTMGVMDGYTAGRIIRQKFDSLQIPRSILIALSGHDDESEREKCLGIGFDGFLAKPFNINELIDILDDVRYQRELDRFQQ